MTATSIPARKRAAASWVFLALFLAIPVGCGIAVATSKPHAAAPAIPSATRPAAQLVARSDSSGPCEVFDRLAARGRAGVSEMTAAEEHQWVRDLWNSGGATITDPNDPRWVAISMVVAGDAKSDRAYMDRGIAALALACAR